MENLVREEFKNILKNNEYNNISIRIIKDSKKEGTKKVIDHTHKKKQNISINIQQNYLSNFYISNKKISNASLNTNPSDNTQNKLSVKKAEILNKITSSNLKKISKKLNEMKHYGSTSNFKRDEKKNNYSIYISKKPDSSTTNIINNKCECNNNNFTQIMPANKISSQNINHNNILLNNNLQPQRRNTSLIYSINNITQNINNKNIINNYIFDSNTYRNPNIQSPSIKNYNFMTHNVRKDRTNDEINQRNSNNKTQLFYNNTLTTFTELKNGKLLSHRLNRKDLENLKSNKILKTNNSSKGENLYFNPMKNKSFMEEIPNKPFNRYDSKDKFPSKINPNVTFNMNNYNLIKNHKSFQSTIRISSASKKNLNDNYENNLKKNKIDIDIINTINIQKNLTKPNEKNFKDIKTILYKNQVKDLINKKIDNKTNNTNQTDIKKATTQIKQIPNKEYIKEKIKEEKEENFNKSNKNLEDHTKQKSHNEKEKENNKADVNETEILFVNRRLFTDLNKKVILNKFIKKNEKQKKKHKEPLDSIRKLNNNKNKKKPNKKEKEKEKNKPKNLNNINTQNTTTKKENKTIKEIENLKSKTIINIKDKIDSKTLISERIKNVIMNKRFNTLKKMNRLSFTAKKDYKSLFRSKLSDRFNLDSIPEIRSKHINDYKRTNYGLVSSLSVKDHLRKRFFNGKKYLDKSFNKYQFTEDKELEKSESNNNTTTTGKKLDNYTYLELKDIKNAKRDNFITLHSIGGVRNDSRFDDFETYSLKDLDFKEFKPYVALHPDKKFKKRGLSGSRMNSERKISGIRIVGNTDSIKYQLDKFNLSSIKKDYFMGNSSINIHSKINKE